MTNNLVPETLGIAHCFPHVPLLIVYVPCLYASTNLIFLTMKRHIIATMVMIIIATLLTDCLHQLPPPRPGRLLRKLTQTNKSEKILVEIHEIHEDFI